MNERLHLLARAFAAAVLAGSVFTAAASGLGGAGNFCMDVEIEPFHMAPDGSCAVRDFWDGALQEAFYPFTIEDHLFNCDYFGPMAPLPTGDMVSSSVTGEINGTIGGHPFSAKLLCASLTNWYQDSCADPEDPTTCSFQLAQPFLNLIDRDPYPRLTEVSVFDGVVTVERGKGKIVEIPLVMATRAAGITHLESLDPEALEVGASVTHSLLGMVTYGADDGASDVEELDGSLDLLLQGHIFWPTAVENDPGAAVIKGAICSEELYQLLNGRGKKRGKGAGDD